MAVVAADYCRVGVDQRHEQHSEQENAREVALVEDRATFDDAESRSWGERAYKNDDAYSVLKEWASYPAFEHKPHSSQIVDCLASNWQG